jgi:hypothetical protein
VQISCEATGGDVQLDLKGEAQGPPPAYSHSMVRFPVNSRLPDSNSRLANFEFPVRGCMNFPIILKLMIFFEVWVMKIGKFPLNFRYYVASATTSSF